MKKLLAIVLVAVMALSLGACGTKKDNSSAAESSSTEVSSAAESSAAESSEAESSAAETKHRVACILGGPISDMSWNYTAHQGMLKIEALGAEIAYQENVENSGLADCVNTYANDGFDLIFISSNSYEETLMPIVADYPNTTFIIINGATSKDNVYSYAVADEAQGFLMGALCALVSENKNVGFVGAMEITPILNGKAGFEQGAKYVDPEITVNAVMTGTFTDVNAAKETALAMIGQGVDAIAPMCDDAALGVDEAAEQGKILCVASGEGQQTIAPNAVITAVVKDTSMVYEAAYKNYLEGKLTTGSVPKMGAAEGVVYLSDWYEAGANVSDEVKTKINEIYTALAKGEITINLD